jgi:uncharacterized membrane protein
MDIVKWSILNYLEDFIMKNAIKKIIVKIRESSIKGEGTTNVLIGIIIAVVAAGIVIALVSASFPELWNQLMSRITSLFS